MDDPNKKAKPEDEEEGEALPVVQIFEIVKSEKENEVIHLLEIETVDLRKHTGRQIEGYMCQQYSNQVQLSVDNNL